jgi:hypothetical protein
VARVRHQHAVAAGEAEVGGQRGALVAALFLDDLDQQDLAALDYVLDLVAAAERLAAGAQVVHFLGPRLSALALAAATAAAAARTAVGLAFLVDHGLAVVVLGPFAVLDVAVLDRSDVVLFARVDFLDVRNFLIAFVAAEVVLVLVSAQRRFFLGVRAFLGE